MFAEGLATACGPLPRWRSPELAAGHWGGSAATVAPGPHGATYTSDRRAARNYPRIAPRGPRAPVAAPTGSARAPGGFSLEDLGALGRRVDVLPGLSDAVERRRLPPKLLVPLKTCRHCGEKFRPGRRGAGKATVKFPSAYAENGRAGPGSSRRLGLAGAAAGSSSESRLRFDRRTEAPVRPQTVGTKLFDLHLLDLLGDWYARPQV
jgi:hypothetical protein